MSGISVIKKYFPGLTTLQQQQFEKIKPLYEDWNSKINVISRKDMEHFYIHHVLHSLGIAKVISFQPGTKIMDVGTGGGFPGIPLAVLFPQCHFHLVDSIGKKIKVVNEVSAALGLKNITTEHNRAENINRKFHFIVSRAVTTFEEFIPWIKNKTEKENFNSLPNGILYLKGGDLAGELATVKSHYEVTDLKNIFTEDFFETKKVIYVSL
ncbi:MAG: 16S rRNA (guanine(527)-N(7))-methyltransferase RsmG [Bacteroidota bacterium]